jgi:NitT/TauT family transport system substrate-binding protein
MNSINRRTAIKAFGTGLLGAAGAPFLEIQAYGQNQPTKVNLTLPWVINGSYIAFIAAQELGYWRDRGVDVTVSRGYGSPDAIKKVYLGQFNYGDASFETVVKTASEGIDVVGLGMHMPVCPMCIISLKKNGITEPKHLEGKTLGALPGAGDTLFFPAFAKATGVDSSKVNIKMLAGDVRAATLLNGGVDALTGYYNTDAPQIWAGGSETNIIMEYKYGIKMYGTGMLSTRTQLSKVSNEVTKAIVEGAMLGLKYTYLKPSDALDMHIARTPELQGSAHLRETTKYQMLLNTALGMHAGARENGLGYYVTDVVAESVKLAEEYMGLKKGVDPKALFTNANVGTVKLSASEWAEVEKDVKPYIIW